MDQPGVQVLLIYFYCAVIKLNGIVEIIPFFIKD